MIILGVDLCRYGLISVHSGISELLCKYTAYVVSTGLHTEVQFLHGRGGGWLHFRVLSLFVDTGPIIRIL